MPIEDLSSDAWSLVLAHCAKDTLGNFTVPGLAQVATYRLLGREVVRGAAELVTPYDATIQFVANGRTRVPVSFYGGIHFAKHRFGKGFSLLRDARTGEMFAVTHEEGVSMTVDNGRSGVGYEVKRIYPLARLAQLLGGHASEWSLTMPDLHMIGTSKSEPRVLSGHHRRPLRTASLRYGTLTSARGAQGVIAKNQLRSRQWKNEPGPLEVHYDDFFSHWVLHIEAKMYVKVDDFVMATSVNGDPYDVMLLPKKNNWAGNDHTVCGIAGPERCSVNEHEDSVHSLSRAFGWNCEPRVAQGPGWLVSMLTHGDAGLPTSLGERPVTEDDLKNMGELAKEARWEVEHAKTLPYHAVDNPQGFDLRMRGCKRPRAKRAAAVVAKARMLEHDGAAINLNGSIARVSGSASESETESDGGDVAAQGMAGGPTEWYKEQVEAGGSNSWHYEREEERGDVPYVQPRRRKSLTSLKRHKRHKRHDVATAPKAPKAPKAPERSERSAMDYMEDVVAFLGSL